jgi:methylated-DNA-protein-cysteine methyltransferase related protein
MYQTWKLEECFISIAAGSPFFQSVIQWILKIPTGKVATYKQIAMLSGKEHGSRGVAWILHSSSTKYKLPWHRVLNSKGRISFDRTTYNFKEQKRRLKSEGVDIDLDGQLKLEKFQWKKFPRKPKRKPGQPHMFSGGD